MRTNRKSNTEKAAKGITACINNAEAYLNAADILLRAEKWRESFLLALYAMEEIGKVVFIFNYPFHARSPERIKKWKNRFNDHTEKLWSFIGLVDMQKGKIPTNKKAEGRAIKDKRLKICYVDYRDDDFQVPEKVSAADTRELLEKTRSQLAEILKRHPSEKELFEQLEMLEKMPEEKLTELRKDLMSKGFIEQDRGSNLAS